MKSGPPADFEPMSVKEAAALLTSLQPSQVLGALRHQDFVMLAGLAFQGFRLDTGGYTNPVVRRRLAEEAAKNPLFATKLRDLSKQPPPTPTASPTSTVQPSKSAPHKPDTDRELEKYKLERDRLRQERDTAVAAKQAAERQLTDVKRELLAAQTSKAESERELERSRQRTERIERKQRQLETANAALRRAAVLPPPSHTPAKVDEIVEPKSAKVDEPLFADAVRHLLTKNREAVALSLVNDVLRTRPDDVTALEIKADALLMSDKARDAIVTLRSLVSLYIRQSALAEASSTLSKLLSVSTPPINEAKSVREFMNALAKSTTRLRKDVEALAILRTENPAAFEVVKSLTPAALLLKAFPEDTVYAPDAPLPLQLTNAAGLVVTARRLIAAIDHNDTTVVELAQDAYRKITTTEREKISSSLTAAVDGDPIYAMVVAPKFARGPVVVDCSNVAWHGQEMLAQQQPRVEYILAMRRALREKGFFPVILIGDANLPFVVNDSGAVRRMVDDDQMLLVISGSDADQDILREAKRLNAPVVTNDYMQDWDPEQTVVKIQYSFATDGKPSIYF